MIKLAITYIDEKGFGKAKTFNFPVDFDVDNWLDRHYPTCFGVHFPKPLRRRIKGAIEDFIVGIKDGYPICCIIHFCIDNILGLFPGITRYSDRTEYVECWLCLKRNGGVQRYPRALNGCH